MVLQKNERPEFSGRKQPYRSAVIRSRFLVVNYASVSEAKQRKSGAFASVAGAPLSVLLFVGLLSREFILYGVYFVLLHTTCGIPALLLHFVIDGVLYA